MHACTALWTIFKGTHTFSTTLKQKDLLTQILARLRLANIILFFFKIYSRS